MIHHENKIISPFFLRKQCKNTGQLCINLPFFYSTYSFDCKSQQSQNRILCFTHHGYKTSWQAACLYGFLTSLIDDIFQHALIRIEQTRTQHQLSTICKICPLYINTDTEIDKTNSLWKWKYGTYEHMSHPH